MEDREHVEGSGAERVDLRVPPDACDPGLILGDQLGREVPQGHDHLGLDQPDLLEQIGTASVELVGLWVAISRRTAHQGVGDENLISAQSDALEQVIEETAGPADERQSPLVLLGTGGLADEHQVGVGVAGAEDDRIPGLGKAAFRAGRTLPEYLDELLPAFLGRAGRRAHPQGRFPRDAAWPGCP